MFIYVHLNGSNEKSGLCVVKKRKDQSYDKKDKVSVASSGCCRENGNPDSGSILSGDDIHVLQGNVLKLIASPFFSVKLSYLHYYISIFTNAVIGKKSVYNFTSI